jgi:hypothetical protein
LRDTLINYIMKKEMELYHGNIEIIKSENNIYQFTDNETVFILSAYPKADKIEFTLTKEGGTQTYKADINHKDLSTFSLFKVVESLDNVLQIIDGCLTNKEVTFTYQKGYRMIFFNLFFKTYLTAELFFLPEDKNLETTISRLSSMVETLYKENKKKTEEINALKALVANSKDQIKSLTDSTENRLLIQENMNLELKGENVKIKERLLALEDPINIALKSKILKKEDYQILRLWLRVDFNLELIYSSYKDGDKIAAFNSKCSGIAPTLTVIKAENGKRFGGYATIKWNPNGSYQQGSGNDFIFSLDNSAKYLNTNLNYTIVGSSNNFSFGNDLTICDAFTTNQNSSSNFPTDYNGVNAVNFTGGKNFKVAILEVFKVI